MLAKPRINTIGRFDCELMKNPSWRTYLDISITKNVESTAISCHTKQCSQTGNLASHTDIHNKLYASTTIN